VSKFSSDPGFLKVFSETEKEMLKNLAIALEDELKIVAVKSKDMKMLSEFPGLLDAIGRAKSKLIERNESIDGMGYFYFHSDMPEHRASIPSLSSFELLLEGIDFPAQYSHPIPP
jgi:hypothetical protein